jgi:hypothetical protein
MLSLAQAGKKNLVGNWSDIIEEAIIDRLLLPQMYRYASAYTFSKKKYQ